MMNRFKALGAACTLAFAGSTFAAAVPGQGTWETTLGPRDLNGDGVADAFYDTDLHITWLDAVVSGYSNWSTAVSWADNLSFGAYTGWRLPTTNVSCEGYNCTGSEMGYLWYAELGNIAMQPMSNSGNFQNLRPNRYWSGTEFMPGEAWSFGTNFGGQTYLDEQFGWQPALAVHPGDVGDPVIIEVPEPAGYALMLAGLGVLGVIARRPSAIINARPTIQGW